MTNNNASPYSLLSDVPLIKAPAMWVPPPVVIPPDIHPLPTSITPYFVYSYTLEPQALSYLQSLPSHPANIEASRASNTACLIARKERKEAEKREREEAEKRRKREELRRVAPGWGGGEEGGANKVLEPTKRMSVVPVESLPVVEPMPVEVPRDAMDELIDGLERMSRASDQV